MTMVTMIIMMTKIIWMDDRFHHGLHFDYDFQDGLNPCYKPWDDHDDHIRHSLHPFYDPREDHDDHDNHNDHMYHTLHLSYEPGDDHDDHGDNDHHDDHENLDG